METTFAKSIPFRPSNAFAFATASLSEITESDAIQQFIAPFSLKIVVISLVSTSAIPITSFFFKNSPKVAFDLQLLGVSQKFLTTIPEA